MGILGMKAKDTQVLLKGGAIVIGATMMRTTMITIQVGTGLMDLVGAAMVEGRTTITTMTTSMTMITDTTMGTVAIIVVGAGIVEDIMAAAITNDMGIVMAGTTGGELECACGTHLYRYQKSRSRDPHPPTILAMRQALHF